MEQYPRVFGSNEFLTQYPYALATIVSGAFAASAAILSAVFIDEVSMSAFRSCSTSLTDTIDTRRQESRENGWTRADVDMGSAQVSGRWSCPLPLWAYHGPRLWIHRRYVFTLLE